MLSKRFIIFLSSIILSTINISATAGSWQNNVSIGGFSNTHIYTPDTLSPIGNGKSLLIVLHGCVQPIDNFLTANLEDAAEEFGMVIAVPDAMNKAGFSCWSYWSGAVSRTSADYKNLITLANTMSADTNRNIDPKQVYITGLSSGSAMAAQTGCLAPDVFAGIAPSAGPTIGTSSNGAITTCETVSTSTFKSRCEGYAGTNSSHFSTQIAVIAHGTADTTVNSCYNQQNADGFATVYGASQLSGTTTITESAGHTADQTLWSDGRVSMLWLNSLDHSWSGGDGASGSYVAGDSINFASYLGAHFRDNNKRVDRNEGPVISNPTATDQGDNTFIITGNAVDAEGSVTSVTISISNIDSGTPVAIETINTTAAPSDGFYTEPSSTLADGLYAITAIGTDNESKDGEANTINARVGPIPPATAPVISNVTSNVNAQCATVNGTVIDINLDLDTVVVAFSNGNVNADIDGNTFTAVKCNLAGGSQSVTITATDATNLNSIESASFTIDAGSTGDYNFHISEGHITWGNGYSACYLEFSTTAFTMRESSAGNGQCEWVADGAPACNGPAQTCSTPTNDADSDTIIDSIDNCPNDANTDQADDDNDGLGNVCDDDVIIIDDADNDGVEDSLDNCPNIPNADQADDDNDGLGNPCDGDVIIDDADNDGVEDSLDNCPNISNPDQADDDNDGLGNPCDNTSTTCSETNASNYAHVQAGRASTSGGYTYAIGSGDSLGLYNIFFTTTLAETATGYYEQGSCP